MRTVYLHIGRGKTGTTHLQASLSRSRDSLLACGIHYVLADDQGRGTGHQQFAKSFIDEVPDYMIPAHKPGLVRRQVADEILASTAQSILLSSENFPSANRENIHAFFSELPEAFDIKIILLVRSQDELAESEYNQMVKLKRETCSFAEYANEKLEDVDYLKLASEWEAVFGVGSVLCKVYDGASFDVVERFGSLLPGLTAGWNTQQRTPADAIANKSLGFRTLAAFRLLNGIELEEREEIYAQIQRGLQELDAPALFFNSQDAHTFRTKFADSNRAFCKRFLRMDAKDLGGRRYSDSERDRIYDALRALKLDPC